MVSMSNQYELVVFVAVENPVVFQGRSEFTNYKLIKTFTVETTYSKRDALKLCS